MPKVCVLIPAYNCQEDLNKSIDSLSREGNGIDFTTIIVDDGSKIPIKIPDTKVKTALIRLPQNQGLVAALNEGLRFARENDFEFVARLDAGDENLPGRLTRQFNQMSREADLGVLGSNAYFVTPDRKRVGQSHLPIGHENIRKQMYMNSAFIHPSTMIRMSALIDVGFYDPQFAYAEDYDLFFRLLEKYRVENLVDPLILYEVSEKQQTHQKWKKQVFYRFKAQRRYFNPLNMNSWKGILRTLFLLMIPQFVYIYIRARRWNY